jgi:hypothetical protein
VGESFGDARVRLERGDEVVAAERVGNADYDGDRVAFVTEPSARNDWRVYKNVSHGMRLVSANVAGRERRPSRLHDPARAPDAAVIQDAFVSIQHDVDPSVAGRRL